MPSRSRSCSPEDYRSSKPHRKTHMSSSENKRQSKHRRKEAEDDHPRRRDPEQRAAKTKWEDSPELGQRRIKREPSDSPPRRHQRRITEERSYRSRGSGRGQRPGRSRSGDRERRENDDRRREAHREREGQEDWGQAHVKEEKPPVDKVKPDFKLSGKLAEDTNTYKGVVIKYNEPPEAKKPKKLWRLYPFKGDQALPVLHLHRQSAFLLGRERKIADIPIDHPSCSKQHAVLQFRLVPYEREDGSKGRRVCPYVIDLNSANGTFVNNQRVDPQRYVQLFEKDVVKFGFSSREYVLLHGSSDTTELNPVAAEDEDDGDDEGID